MTAAGATRSWRFEIRHVRVTDHIIKSGESGETLSEAIA